jgi:putative hemolysin
VPMGDGIFRVSGKASIHDVNELLEVDLPDEEWDTVAGLVLDLLGHIPKGGEEVQLQGLRFRAEEVVRRRVATVVITRVPIEELEGAEE